MTKTMKSRLALLLALAMMVCLLAVPAAAEDNAPNEYGIKTYVALGDSIATGLNDNTGTNEDAYGSWENGYTVKLAEKLNLITEESPKYVPEGYNFDYYTFPPFGFRITRVIGLIETKKPSSRSACAPMPQEKGHEKSRGLIRVSASGYVNRLFFIRSLFFFVRCSPFL